MPQRTKDDVTPISVGRDLPIHDRFGYRSLITTVYKRTPQADLEIDVHLPYDWQEGDRRSGILFLFGGGWTTGTRHQFTRQASYLAARGMVAATADYRVRQYHGTGVDTCVEDAFSAMRWFRAHADDLGLDPARIASSGGSAGGHLAAAVATLEGFDAKGEDTAISVRPNAMVLFNPAVGVFSHRDVGDFGVTSDMIERLEPINGVTADLPPMHAWYGTEDRLLPLAQPFFERARELGCRVSIDLAEGADHGYFNDFAGFFHSSLYHVDEFLASIGYVEGAPLFTIME